MAQAGLVCHCFALLNVFSLADNDSGVPLRVLLPLRAAAAAEMSATTPPDGAGGLDPDSATSHAESDAAGAARGAPRRRAESPAHGSGDSGADPAADAANGLGAPVEVGVHAAAEAAPVPAPAPVAPTVGTEEEVLSHLQSLVDHVLSRLQARFPTGPSLPTPPLTARAQPGAPASAATDPAAPALREAVAAALIAARWDVEAVIADASQDLGAWRAKNGLADRPDELSCTLCDEEMLVTQLSCGHALCAGCAARTAGMQAKTRPCLAAACEVAHGRVLCPAGNCAGFMPRAAVDAFRTEEQRDAMAGPLRLAPLARGPYVRCFACPLLLHRRGADDAAAAGLRCHCGARTCASRGGAEECCGRAHAPLSCAAARDLELIIGGWHPVLQAARGPAAEARVPELVVLPRLDDIALSDSDDEEMHAAPPAEAGGVVMPGLLSDDDAGTDEEEEEMRAAAPNDHQMHLNDLGDQDMPGLVGVGGPPEMQAAARRVVLGEGGGMPILLDSDSDSDWDDEDGAPARRNPRILHIHNYLGGVGRRYDHHQRGRTDAAVAAHVAALSVPRLTAAAAAVLQGRGPAEGDAHLAAVAADATAVLASADAACAPLRDGPALRLRRLLRDAKQAAEWAQERVLRALNEAEIAARAAGRAIAAPGAAEVAARAAAEAAADATAAAASARASADAAAEAAARLATPDARDAEGAAEAAAVAAIADTADEMVNVARGHAAAANDARRAALDAAAAGAPAAAGADAATLTDVYMQSHTRPCPGCGAATQKGRGECNSMDPCHKCGRTWCWSCLGPAHEHSYGPCSKAGNRAAIEAAIAAARPEAAAHAAAHAEAMAAADAVANATGRRGRRPIPRPVAIADTERVPEAEAELATLALATTALRLHAAAGDAAGTATQLRMVRVLLAEIARAAGAAEAWQREHQVRQERIEALRMRAQREQAERAAPRARPVPAAAPDPDADIAMPLRAAAERAATALAAAYDAAPGAPPPAGVRDFAGAAIAWARMHIARENEAAALAAATTLPAAVARSPEVAAAWRAGLLATAAAEAALSRASIARIFDTLRLPTTGEEIPPQAPQHAPEHLVVRDEAAHLRAVMRALDAGFSVEAVRAAIAEDAQREGELGFVNVAQAVADIGEKAARLRALADGLAAPW